MRKLLIVDPTLVSLQGHSYNYDRAIRDAGRAHFDEVVLYTDRRFRAPPDDNLDYRPTLNRVPLQYLKRSANAVFHTLAPRGPADARADVASTAHATVVPGVWGWMIHLAKLLRARDMEASLRRILKDHLAAGPGEVHVLIQHAQMHDLLAADRLRGSISEGGAEVHLDLILRASPELVNVGYLAERDFAALLRRLAESSAPFIHLLTDSDRLSREYRSLGASPVGTLPVPVLFPEGPILPDHLDSGELRVAFLGSSRVEQGFGELPGILRALPSGAGGKRIRAMVQVSADSADPRIRETIHALRALKERLPPGAIELLESPAPLPRYYSWLRRAGMVILPYISPKYRSSTSGVFAEAICFGVPVVCPSGSWMSDVIEEARARSLRIGEAFSGLEEIPGLIARIGSELSRYARDTCEFAERWRAEHNADACVRALLASTRASP